MFQKYNDSPNFAVDIFLTFLYWIELEATLTQIQNGYEIKRFYILFQPVFWTRNGSGKIENLIFLQSLSDEIAALKDLCHSEGKTKSLERYLWRHLA